nr:hypothetical protein [Tanacetum cinerariifolium]
MGVDTSLFDGMLVPHQVHDGVAAAAEDEDAANEISVEPTPPSPTPATTPPPQQELIPSSLQVESTPPPLPHQSPISQLSSSPPQQPPFHDADISMTLLKTLLETCATLTKQVANLKQDKIAQAIEITKLKQRVRRLEKKRKLKALRLKNADEDVMLKEVEKDIEDQGRLPESQAQVYHLDLEHAQKVLNSLRDALDITPTNNKNPYVAPPSSDTVIEYVNTLGYPSTLKNVSEMSVNALYQPWRAILSMINMCLTEFVQSIQTFLTNRKNLATALRGKKKTTHLLVPNVRFFRKDGREIFDMLIPDAILIDEIKGAPYYGEYQEHVAKYQQYLDAEHGKAEERGAIESLKATKVTKPKAAKATKPASHKASTLTSTQPPKPKPAPTQPSKVVPEKKQKLVKETPDEPSLAKRSKGGLVGKIRMPRSPLKLVDEPSAKDVLVEEPAYNEEESNLQRALELSLKEQVKRT